ncbi:MAG: hypothetical protein IT379_41905 [Deltaproteobacteria bacterium]|nr:hypothetical protein [Deltaproteobacteria bacterium]
MGFLDALFGDGSTEVLEALKHLPHGDRSIRETDFRDSAAEFLSATLRDVELKREAGVSGTGTRVDLYAHYRGHDYLITIKKGLSEQKIKKVIGECHILLDHWQARVPGRKTYIIFLPFALARARDFDDFAIPFLKFAGGRSDDRFEITLALPMGGLPE